MLLKKKIKGFYEKISFIFQIKYNTCFLSKIQKKNFRFSYKNNTPKPKK